MVVAGGGGSLMSGIRRMCYFVLFPSPPGLGIAGKLGLSVSLSAYKDKYVTEGRTEMFGDDRCALKSRAPKTFEAIWCASLAATAAVSLPAVYLHVCLKCVISPSLSFCVCVCVRVFDGCAARACLSSMPRLFALALPQTDARAVSADNRVG